jgi:iron-sulfur cluster repair protein YtfE (RIC family)
MISSLTLPAPSQVDVQFTDSTTVVSTTVNPAFFQEIKDDNLELCKTTTALKRLLRQADRPMPGRLLGLLERLRDLLAMHFRLEEAYGYFQNPVVVDFEISTRAESLMSEHQTLYMQINDIVDHAEYIACVKTCRSLWPQVVQRVTAFCDQLQEHEHREFELIMQAYRSVQFSS